MDNFNKFFTAFKSTSHWETMVGTVEASPWHREANVAVHTQMVLDQYNARFATQRTAAENNIARFALLFHDVGKPDAEEALEKKDGSGEIYRRYAGHEQISAVEFSELYATSVELRAALTPIEARAVRWIIEHHLPYDLKDKLKRAALAQGTHAAMLDGGVSYNTFFDCLRSDAAGRISDDHQTKLENVENWITEFSTLPTEFKISQSTTTMYILVGPSGSGKTTWIKNRIKGNDRVISMDAMKIEFYEAKVEDRSSDPIALYAAAWAFANENESEFKKFVIVQTKQIMDSVRSCDSVFVDITNLSKKRRAIWVEHGRRKKMHMIGVEFLTPVEVLAGRQYTRGDKHVPYSSLLAQVKAQTLCYIGHEVDLVQQVITPL